MNRRPVKFAEVDVIESASAGCYRLRLAERVELEIPRGFDPEEVFTLLLLAKEAQL